MPLEELCVGDKFRVKDEGKLLEVGGLTEWIAASPPYLNEEGLWQIDYDYLGEKVV